MLHLITDLETGGAEIMLAKLVGAMDCARFSNTVISLTDRGQLGEQIESSGVVVHTLGMKRGRPDISALPRLIRLFKSLNPTIVQSWLYHADFLSTLAVRFAGSPILVWNVRCSEMDLTRYPPLTRWVQRVLAQWSATPAAVIVNSEAGKQLHEQIGYQPRRWDVIPNGFDTQRFHPDSSVRVPLRKEWDVPDDAVIVALVARVDPMKDHSTFLDAAQEVSKARQNAHFFLVGKDTQTLAPAVSVRGLTDRVRLLGYRSDIERLLPGVDVLCLSSVGEGFPNVLGEAMACGIPCVSTDVGDARSIIADTGVVVPVRDPASLAHAIIGMIDRGLAARERLGRAARARIEGEYSLSKIVDRYTALYSDLSVNGSLAP
ncbi:MAG TPA: GT4 family glycosyltransferase PelF [Nitrospiraceae bacterium]|nr:GT4 family glycosyltransferase PelF [Nitrospiraceae bacterium]